MSADDVKVRVTGQVFFRDTGLKAADGRRIFWSVSVVSVPSDFHFEPEHQYTVSGSSDGSLQVHKETAVDLTDKAMGKGADGLLKAPIWKV